MPRPITDHAAIVARLSSAADVAAHSFAAAALFVQFPTRNGGEPGADTFRVAHRAADRCLVLRRHLQRLLGTGDPLVILSANYPTVRGLRVVANYMDRSGFPSAGAEIRAEIAQRLAEARARLRAAGILSTPTT